MWHCGGRRTLEAAPNAMHAVLSRALLLLLWPLLLLLLQVRLGRGFMLWGVTLTLSEAGLRRAEDVLRLVFGAVQVGGGLACAALGFRVTAYNRQGRWCRGVVGGARAQALQLPSLGAKSPGAKSCLCWAWLHVCNRLVDLYRPPSDLRQSIGLLEDGVRCCSRPTQHAPGGPRNEPASSLMSGWVPHTTYGAGHVCSARGPAPYHVG